VKSNDLKEKLKRKNRKRYTSGSFADDYNLSQIPSNCFIADKLDESENQEQIAELENLHACSWSRCGEFVAMPEP